MTLIKTALTDYINTIHLKAFKRAYDQTFIIKHCDDTMLKQRAITLCHKVFCEEYRSTASQNSPKFSHSIHDTHAHADPYDERTKRFILQHRQTNETVGTARLIMPNDDDPKRSFPIQQYCDASILHDHHRPLTVCELSNVCFLPRYRNRWDDGRFMPAFQQQDSALKFENGGVRYIRRRIGYAPAGLLSAAFESALNARIMDIVWMVEPEHLWSLDMIGMQYHALGTRIETMGGLTPIIFNIKHTLDNMRRTQPACWEVISDNGRLQGMADTLYQNDWKDEFLD